MEFLCGLRWPDTSRLSMRTEWAVTQQKLLVLMGTRSRPLNPISMTATARNAAESITNSLLCFVSETIVLFLECILFHNVYTLWMLDYYSMSGNQRAETPHCFLTLILKLLSTAGSRRRKLVWCKMVWCSAQAIIWINLGVPSFEESKSHTGLPYSVLYIPREHVWKPCWNVLSVAPI